MREGDGPSRRRHTASEDLPLRGRSLPSSPRLAKPSNYRCFCYYRFLYYELLFTEGRGPFLQFRSGSRNSPGARATQPPHPGEREQARKACQRRGHRERVESGSERSWLPP